MNKKQCLNGWWDFRPVFEPLKNPDVPKNGWQEKAYLVPSFWTKALDGVRKPGETYFQKKKSIAELEPDHEFLFDAFQYPFEWTRTRSAWVRRRIAVNARPHFSRYFLGLEAVMPKTKLYVNGRYVAGHVHPTLPFEVEVTEFLRSGENEIAVLIEDYDRDSRGRPKVPTGNWIPIAHCGIWQDVWLIERPPIYISDVTIRTSVRKGEIHVRWEITNAASVKQSVRLKPSIVNWVKGGNFLKAKPVLVLPEQILVLNPKEVKTIEVCREWKAAELWYPENPGLYLLRTISATDAGTPETHLERFGFREVWIDGRHLMLNDYPAHLFSDWGHKTTPYYYTEGWIRKWFGMLRAANMNHSRLHTHPHPKIHLDLADEEGILITGETGLHGSGGQQASDNPEYWQAARDHVRRFVRRDKNHPALILWSVENEMRWNGDETFLARHELPKLRMLFNELDPTRPAYHEGDSSLWNEKEQALISRHYGKECSGLGWWDGKQPLHSGEMSVYHFQGPNTTLNLGGDATYASFRACDEAAGRDTAWIVEAGRTLGVCCFGPWNLSCLSNLRLESRPVKLKYKDFTKPGVKPLYVPAHCSEFSFWKKGKGYAPNYCFPIQAGAFRPFALIDRSRKNAYFSNSVIRRELFVVNDTPAAVKGRLVVELKRNGVALKRLVEDVIVGRGRVERRIFEAPLPDAAPPGRYAYSASFVSGNKVLARWTRSIRVARRASVLFTGKPLCPAKIAVFGPRLLAKALSALGLDFEYVPDLSAAALANAKILIMEKNTVQPDSAQNRDIKAFVRKGARALIFEQTRSLFPSVKLEPMDVQTAFMRAYAHPVLAGLANEDFSFWGEDAYPLLSGDAFVARRMYRKNNLAQMLPLLDSGEGLFDSGDLEHTPLFEAREGRGLILAVQLELTEKMPDCPSAEKLFVNLLQYAFAYKPDVAEPPLITSGSVAPEKYIKAARNGRTVVVNAASPSAIARWGKALGTKLPAIAAGEIYQAVRVKDDPVLNGISNHDTCGIESWAYAANASNAVIADCALLPSPKLEPLLETATESCLKELFVCGGKTEPLRAHTCSRFLFAEKPCRAVLLGRLRAGKGWIIFNQLKPSEKARRILRFHDRLLANLGYAASTGLLDGDRAVAPQGTSAGYPQKIYALNAAADEALKRRLAQNTVPSESRILSSPILLLGDWKTVENQNGIWNAAGLDLSKDIFLYYALNSPVARKNINVDMGVPHPEALTFLDFTGEGRIEFWLNGRRHEPLVLSGKTGTISDISLNQGYNYALLKWIPASPKSTLRMQWRDIMRRPEIWFSFAC